MTFAMLAFATPLTADILAAATPITGSLVPEAAAVVTSNLISLVPKSIPISREASPSISKPV